MDKCDIGQRPINYAMRKMRNSTKSIIGFRMQQKHISNVEMIHKHYSVSMVNQLLNSGAFSEPLGNCELGI
jgi:hypothetical protein